MRSVHPDFVEAQILKRIEGKCFCDRDVRLDGFQYVDCSFYACRFIYSGKKDFSLTGNMVSSDCSLVVRDSAAETIAALSDLYGLGDWGRQTVLSALGNIAELAEAAEMPIH